MRSRIKSIRSLGSGPSGDRVRQAPAIETATLTWNDDAYANPVVCTQIVRRPCYWFFHHRLRAKQSPVRRAVQRRSGCRGGRKHGIIYCAEKRADLGGRAWSAGTGAVYRFQWADPVGSNDHRGSSKARIDSQWRTSEGGYRWRELLLSDLVCAVAGRMILLMAGFTPRSPHLAKSGFHILRKLRRVHERRGEHARAKR